ncbi:hypothetical protein ONS95_014970 [Cadophora gregata]|uniref:uncharacterized protein n=1 Tax=Cadophora gregata TaxID=51156 RepID=UPI0026DAEC8A|nr:uncharacterized protein ONS95_014970 [Cadophora gregata]KAK0103173.1 hypothetical protein ONS96_005779 [Cadophora gregata f. sp. sojae]KAK0113276.1 hypothetical protein ONS95_014970 [Cadophora gregata]
MCLTTPTLTPDLTLTPCIIFHTIFNFFTSMCEYHYTTFKCTHTIQESTTLCAAKIPGAWTFASPACKDGTHTRESDSPCPACDREEMEKKKRDAGVYYSFPEFRGSRRW